MSTETAQNEARHTITLRNKADKRMAYVMVTNRPELAETFEKRFSIKFEGVFGTELAFSGENGAAEISRDAFSRLSGAFAAGTHIDEEHINKVANELLASKLSDNFNASNDNRGGSASGGRFEAKNEAQANLAHLIENNDLVFAVGPAGTGKTHVAIAKAVHALKNKEIKKILLARPATEAGEKLGYLPGDANAKLGPYMRPLYDELDKVYGAGKYQKMMADGTIEIVPVAFMRGRTFSDAFIILDEAQNCTVEQMEMALTRIGEGSRMVVTGDPNQIDRDIKADSGLIFAMEALRDSPRVGVQEFDKTDVVRSKIVTTVVEAFEKAKEKREPAPKKTKDTMKPG